MIRSTTLPVAAAMLVLAACSKTPEPDGATRPEPAASGAHPSPPPNAHPPAAPGHAAADVAFEKPARWEAMPNRSPMRKATFKIPKAEGDAEDGEMSVTQVGGGVGANIARWESQFDAAGPAKKTEKTVDGMRVTIVEIHGTFKGGGMPGGPPAEPKANWALLGAIVETTTPTFFKLTGPDKTVLAAKPEFDAFVAGFKPR